MRTIRRVSAASLLLLGATANVSCTVSPQPIPVLPALGPPGLVAQEVKVVRTASSTELVGAAGAIEDPEATGPVGADLWAFAIDAPGVSAEASVGDSFKVSLASPSVHMIHLEVESFSGQVATSLNFETESDGTLGPLPSPHCLSNNAGRAPLFNIGPIPGDRDVEAGVVEVVGIIQSYTVKLTETCGAKEDIHVALHTGKYFSLRDAPTSIGAHETLSLTIAHSKTDPSSEDVDLLVITDSDPGAMVVSLHAVTSP
jgi:hypothetical protein